MQIVRKRDGLAIQVRPFVHELVVVKLCSSVVLALSSGEDPEINNRN